MKKAIPLILALVMCLSLCACGGEEARLRKRAEESEEMYNAATRNYIDALQEYNDLQRQIDSIKALEAQLR